MEIMISMNGKDLRCHETSCKERKLRVSRLPHRKGDDTLAPNWGENKQFNKEAPSFDCH